MKSSRKNKNLVDTLSRQEDSLKRLNKKLEGKEKEIDELQRQVDLCGKLAVERDVLKRELEIAHKRRLSEDNSVQKSKETYVFLTNDPEQAIASESVDGNQKQVVLEGEIQYLRNEIQELQQQLKRKDDIISVMLAPVSTDEIMAEEVSKLNSKLKEKEIETEKIRTSSDSLNKQIEELKQELDSKTGSMSLEYEDLRMEMDSLRKKNVQLQKQLNDSSEQADQEMTELLGENESLKKNLNIVEG